MVEIKRYYPEHVEKVYTPPGETIKVTHKRRVLFYDDCSKLRWNFEHGTGNEPGLLWLEDVVGNVVEPNIGEFFPDLGYVRMTTSDQNPAVGDRANAYVRLPYYGCKYGFETTFILQYLSNLGRIIFGFRVRNGAYKGELGIRFYLTAAPPGDAAIQYLNSSNSWVNVPTNPARRIESPDLLPVKLVINPKSFTYDKLHVDDKIFDLSGIAGYQETTDTRKSILPYVSVYAVSAGRVQLDWARSCVTVDEP